jgi:hypothetical protein
MERNQTQNQWRIRATPDMYRVAAAASRLSVSMRVNGTTTLAAADELQAASKAATTWFAANPCPDRMLGSFFAGILNSCDEIALAAQRAATEHDTERTETWRRLGRLLALVGAQSRTFETW